ncbi:MAG: prolyl-tRNA synthetase associated domain-containing protein [Methylobacteriaceae bacterium]|nr:prolyl-tRNA synthetase associated domain-containing protein [Methylobacteriaceae bacterium]
MDTPLMTTAEELFECLDALNIPSTTVIHRAVFTVPEGADIKARIPGAHTKNLFVKDKKGRLFLITAKDYTAINMKRAHEAIGGTGRLSFCSAEQLKEYLGVDPGSVTPLAIANDHGRKVKMVLDANLMAHDKINCHPLVNTMTTTLARDDLIRYLTHFGHAPEIVALPEPPAENAAAEE